METQLTQKLPDEISYQRILPKGFPTTYKQWINDPLTGNKVWSNTDIVRFGFLNTKRGVFDPYRSFLEITVACYPGDLPVGLLQVDSSAHSFINQLVLYSENRQIQRITEYTSLLAYLNDVGLAQYLTQGRQTQGLGYGSYDTMPWSKAQSSATSYNRPGNGLGYGTGNIFPTIGNALPQTTTFPDTNSYVNLSKSAKGHATQGNIVMVADKFNSSINPETAAFSALQHTGYFNNIRSEYQTNFQSSKYPQSTQSIPNYWLNVQKGYMVDTKGHFDPKKPYVVEPPQTWSTSLFPQQPQDRDRSTFQTHLINCANFGFSSLFGAMFSRGCFEPFISPTVPQSMMRWGQIQRTKFPIYRRKFKIPVASAIIGILMESANYMLIPLQSINNCYLQLTLDQHAMFTSGYNDISELDETGMASQQLRCYRIQKIQYKLHTYFFTDSSVEDYIRTSLYKQIVTVQSLWSLGNQYQVPANTPPNNTYIIGCTSTSLNQIVCLFVSNDYQKYSFCRKHYRLSNNITKFWCKIGVDYWPPQPFRGNAGNPISNSDQDDNSQFIQNIYWAHNYMFSSNPLPRINVYNFGLNGRAYDVKNRRTFYDPNMRNNPYYKFTADSVNADTAMGMPYIHQNRMIGKAAFVNVFTPFASQQNLLQGINVSGITNFQAVFDTDKGRPATCDQTLYIFCKSSVIVKYTTQGIKVYGR